MAMELPSYLRKTDTAQRFLSGLGSNQPPTISRKNNRFTLRDGAGNEKPVPTLSMEVVFIDANENVSKMYFEGDYNPEESTGPDCWSDNGVAPSIQATKPQNDLCSTCPHNAWGSATSRMSGKATKECQDLKKVACLVPGIGGDIIYLLAIPPASLKVYKQYLATLAGHGLSPEHARTRVGFDTSKLGVLTFEPVGFVDEPTAELVYKLLDADAAATVVGRTDKPRLGLPSSIPAAIPAPDPVAPLPQGEEKFFGGKQEAPAQAEPVQETDAEREAREFAEWKAGKAKATAPSEGEPKRGRGRPRKEETVVGAGPIPAQTFEAKEPPAFLEPEKPVASVPQTGNGAFGMQAHPAPASDAIKDMLAKAFSLPTA